MYRLYCTGVVRVEKGILCTMLDPFHLKRTQLTPTMISIICRTVLTLIPLSHLISKPRVLMCELLRGASPTLSPSVLSHVVFQLGLGPTRFQTSRMIEIRQARLRTHCSDPWGGDDCPLNYGGDYRGPKTFNHLFKVTHLSVGAMIPTPGFLSPKLIPFTQQLPT